MTRRDSTSLACLDVHYHETHVTAACCLFEAWDSPGSRDYLCASSGPAAPYEPGALYLRELPGLLAVLEIIPVRPQILLVDGYVWLPGGKPGLGARLFDALGGAVPVIGVAKTKFRDASHAIPVLRGSSRKALHVTAAGFDPAEAARRVKEMHGADRLPTLLKRVDRLARRGVPGDPGSSRPVAR